MGAIWEIDERPQFSLAEDAAPPSGINSHWNVSLLISTGLGLLVVNAGLSFSIVSWFALLDIGIPSSTIGALLLLVAFFLFYFAAHCMDKVDERRKETRPDPNFAISPVHIV